MFSVIIPLYNKELSIINTIHSVLNQTFQNFEIIVINDGSTDNSAEIVEGIEDSRIRLIHQENKGVSAARNRGIGESRYEWIAFLDGDDLWENGHLEEIVKMIRKFPNDKVFTTSFIRDSEVILNNNSTDNQPILVIEDYFKDALRLSVTNSSIICLNIEVLNKVGIFNENYVRGEDIDLWSRIAKKYRFIKSNLITAIYREDAENRSNLIYVKVRKTFAGHVNLRKCKNKNEEKYYMYFIVNSFKHSILNKRWSDTYYMLYRYNFKLIAYLKS